MNRFQERMAQQRAASDLGNAAIRLGVPVFPCLADKKPATEHGFKDASDDPRQVQTMFARPGVAMIGMPTGEMTGVVIVDVDNKENRQGKAWLDANSHRMPQTRTIRTGSGGLHIYLAWPGQRVKNSNDRIAPGIDVRGDGGYVIVPPSHGYVVADDASIAQVPDWLMPVLCPPEPVHVPSERRAVASEGTPYGTAALKGECEAIRMAGFGNQEHTLNAAGLKIGALVAGGELPATALADLIAAARGMPSQPGRSAWSASQLEHKVRRAFADGQRNPRSPEPMVEPVHPAAAFLAQLYAPTNKEQAKPLPVEPSLLAVDGVLRLFIEDTIRTAIRPQPFLALGAAICVIGALAGRRYRTRTDLRTNIYIAAIAESGGGKDHAPEVARRVIEAAGLGHYLGGETLASGRAVLTAMENHPAKLFQVDEFGLFLASVTGKKAPGHKAEIWTELMKLYSRAKGVYRGTEYANKKENPRVDIHQPCAVFHGTSTPSTFWAALEAGAMLDGSLARFLVFITDNNRPDRNLEIGIYEPNPALVAGLQAIAGGRNPAPKEQGNLGTFIPPMSAIEAPEPYTVPTTSAADALHVAKLTDEDEWAKRVEGTPQAAIVNRLAENASKLALISAISRRPADPVIDRPDVAWGWALAEHATRSLLQDAGRFIAGSDYERRVNKALDIIRKHGPVSDSEMFDRHGLKLPERERAELLRNLATVGLIVAIQPDPTKRGRKTVRYAIAPIASDGTLEITND